MTVLYNPHMLPKLRSEAIMQAAKGRNCTLRISSFIPGHKCSPRTTTVGAHLPVFGKGVSTKVTDLAVVFACQNCHDILDGRNVNAYNFLAEKYPSAIPTRCMNALVETLTILMMDGVLNVMDGKII